MKFNKQQVCTALYQLIQGLNSADSDQGLVLVTAVAKGVAYSLPIPAQRVTSLRAYYTDNAEPIALSVLSDINEAVVFNLRQAKELTFQIYRARYLAAHVVDAGGLHPLVDAIVKADESRSLEPKFAGIFERVTEQQAQTANNVAWNITELMLSATGGDEANG